MIVTLQTERLRTIEQLEAFVEGSAPVDCNPWTGSPRTTSCGGRWWAFDYHRLGKADRGCVRRYVVKVTALSPAQRRGSSPGTRRPAPWWICARATAGGRSRGGTDRHPAAGGGRRGVRPDVGAGDLRDTAPRVRGVRGSALRAADGISRSHVYNLRGSRTYRAKRTTWTKTRAANVAIAVRRAPSRTACRAICGSTPCTRATGTA